MAQQAKIKFYREMFEVQLSYLYHRLHRDAWWGMDYGLTNFTMLKLIVGFAGGPPMDLGDVAWRGALAECWNALGLAAGRDCRDEFVQAAWALFGQPWLSGYPTFERDNAGHTWFGCFRYDYIPAANSVNLHFMNADEPASPFADMARRIEDLRRIVQDVRAKGARPERVGFVSWMNNLRPLLGLFPPSHAASLRPTEEFPKGYGWWGQLITKDSQVNPRRAELMERDGRFEYVRLAGNCPWEDFQRWAGCSTAEG